MNTTIYDARELSETASPRLNIKGRCKLLRRTYGGGWDQHGYYIEVSSEWNFSVLQFLLPVFVQLEPELLIERPRVR